ncbi:MAG: DUF547 domain-containing protein, partial [Sedimentisphaerales bacterium]|nr:DUF547 domain-containing protein [Sedimentisphaerales bacterium]
PEKAEPDELNNTDIAQVKTQKQEEIPGKSEKIEPASAKLFHDKFAGILNDFVNNKGMVDYKGLRREGIKLKALLEEFDNLDPNEYKSWRKEDKIAFWINAYNLHKLKVVSANYPIQSSSRFLRVLWGPTDLRHIENEIAMYKFLVMDEEFTFKKVENRFFRVEFDDPRILLAITDACLSSPPLLNEPYYGEKLEEQLGNQVKKFLSSPLAFKIEGQKRRVYLSAVFETGRYGRQFLKQFAIDRKFKDHPPITRAVLNFITNYVSESEASFLEVGNYSVKYMSYDWTINDGS